MNYGHRYSEDEEEMEASATRFPTVPSPPALIPLEALEFRDDTQSQFCHQDHQMTYPMEFPEPRYSPTHMYGHMPLAEGIIALYILVKKNLFL